MTRPRGASVNREQLAKAIEDAVRPFGLTLVEIDGLRVFADPQRDMFHVHLKPAKEGQSK